MKAQPVDPALWTIAPAFGVAGGPLEHQLTAAGRARAFSVGARVREGAPAEALEALANAGGEGLLTERDGSRHRLTELGRFTQIAWGRLRALGLVESVPDGVRLTAFGWLAWTRGKAERVSLLERVRAAHPIGGS